MFMSYHNSSSDRSEITFPSKRVYHSLCKKLILILLKLLQLRNLKSVRTEAVVCYRLRIPQIYLSFDIRSRYNAANNEKDKRRNMIHNHQNFSELLQTWVLKIRPWVGTLKRILPVILCTRSNITSTVCQNGLLRQKCMCGKNVYNLWLIFRIRFIVPVFWSPTHRKLARFPSSGYTIRRKYYSNRLLGAAALLGFDSLRLVLPWSPAQHLIL